MPQHWCSVGQEKGNLNCFQSGYIAISLQLSGTMARSSLLSPPTQGSSFKVIVRSGNTLYNKAVSSASNAPSGAYWFKYLRNFPFLQVFQIVASTEALSLHAVFNTKKCPVLKRANHLSEAAMRIFSAKTPACWQMRRPPSGTFSYCLILHLLNPTKKCFLQFGMCSCMKSLSCDIKGFASKGFHDFHIVLDARRKSRTSLW